MCFYEQYRFECGDWKWGNFRCHCNKEYRMGETCGMKLVYQTTQLREKCKLCQKVETKKRRKAQEEARIVRWMPEHYRYKASIEKAHDIIRGLDQEIYEIECERYKKQVSIANTTR